MDAFVTGNWHHYVVVDRPHYPLFKHLQGPRRSILLTDDVMPAKMRLLFNIPFVGGRSLWWSSETGLSLGWHIQQMVKIGIASVINEDGLIYCDSDVFFVKPFDTESLSQDGHFRFYRAYERLNLELIPNPEFFNAGLDLLGLPKHAQYFGYIENLITWRRLTVLELCDHLARRHNGKWYFAFRNRLQISEYTLYGLFVDEVQADSNFHTPTWQRLCRTQWSKMQNNSDQEVAAFCTGLEAHQVAVGIQSFLGISVTLLERQFEKALAAHQLKGPAPTPEIAEDSKI